LHLTRLQIDGLRCLKGLDLELDPGLHVFVGPNGIGKTSILEAAALLGSGKSFRAGAREALIGRDAEKLTVYSELIHRLQTHRVGFERNKKSWRARVDGTEVTQLSHLVRLVPVWVVEPNSHELIAGGSEGRRALIDWLLFHVEPNYGALMARYRAALKQRNSVLKSNSDAKLLQPWTELVVQLGLEVFALRDQHKSRWQESVQGFAQALLPELGKCALQIKSSWQNAEDAFQCMAQREPRDRALGFTSSGPHRADWSIHFEAATQREQLSRGQAKNACFAAVFGTLASYSALSGEKPLLCLDDMFSELDESHQRYCLQQAATVAEQVLITGIATSNALEAWPGSYLVRDLQRL
jgi:DNA replication and repair protein RecF